MAPFLALAYILATTPGCHRASSDGSKTLKQTVSAAKVIRGNLSQNLVFQAEFRPWYVVDLHAKVAGFVKTLEVDLGSRVKAGQLLAELEVPLLKEDISRAQAMLGRSKSEVLRAQSGYDEAHLNYGRLQAVVKSQPKVVAQQDIDSALQKDQSAAATVSAAEQQVQIAQSELDRLRTEEADTKITAPFDGVVTELDANPGDLIQGGTSPSGQAKPLVRLAQIDRLRAAFPVSVSQLDKVHQGTPVEIKLDDGRIIKSTISRLSSEVSMSTRTMNVEADVSNLDQTLIPGMYVSAILQAQHRENALIVPLQAINRGRTTTIFVIALDGAIQERPVKIGLETPDNTEITSGVSEGELVVIGGAGRVKPGVQVEPRLIAVIIPN